MFFTLKQGNLHVNKNPSMLFPGKSGKLKKKMKHIYSILIKKTSVVGTE